MGLVITFSVYAADEDESTERVSNSRFATAADIDNVKSITCCDLMPTCGFVSHIVWGTPIPESNKVSLVWDLELLQNPELS